MPGLKPVAAVFVVSDIHGHPEKLIGSLFRAGLTDEAGNWLGRPARLWFLGDFFDRGPDGIGVLELVRRLVEQAESTDGEVRALLGNHEILALGMRRFGSTEVPHDGIRRRSFEVSWTLNGGQDRDQELLTDEHAAWLADLPLLALDGDYLLMHSDNDEYLDWGDSVEEINAMARADLHSDDLVAWWEMWRRMTARYAFRGSDGAVVADDLMRRLGGRRLVHGHSIVSDQLGIEPAELTGPLLYADGRVLAIDGGTFDGGPCLVVRLQPL